jgi:Tol biopolymer transport system component
VLGATAALLSVTGAQGRVSSAASPAVPANESSLVAGISGDGRYVVFVSWAANLVPGDTNEAPDVFVSDRRTGRIERVSVPAEGTQAGVRDAAISADGRFVAFLAADTNGTSELFVRDRAAATTQRVSVGAGGEQPSGDISLGSLSADGRYITFSSEATNFVRGDTNEVRDTFVRDLVAGTTERVSVDSAGAQANADSGSGRISADGRFVAFGSRASNLAPGDTDDQRDVFVRDRVAATTDRVPVIVGGAEIDREVSLTSISADARYLAVGVDDDAFAIGGVVYVLDRLAQTTELVSVNNSGRRVAEWSGYAVLSADGRLVAFDTGKFVSGEWEGLEFGDVFLRDRLAKTTERISVSRTGERANAGSIVGGITANGRYVAFQSEASNLVAGDTNTCGDEGDRFNCTDVFVRDRGARTTTLVSVGGNFARAGRLRLQPWPARAGRPFTATMPVRSGGRPVADGGARVLCKATLAGVALQVATQAFRGATARCAWKIPTGTRGKPFDGSVVAVTASGTASARFRRIVR